MNRIVLSAIPHETIRRFLVLIAPLDAPLVVFGGVARDILFSQISAGGELKINDIDVAAVMAGRIPGPLSYRGTASFRFVPEIASQYRPLCEILGADLSSFRSSEVGIRGSSVEFEGRPLSLMGQRIAFDAEGNERPDLFAHEKRTTFTAVPMALSINCFAIDARGNIYGPRQFRDDFHQRTARFINDPQCDEHSLSLLLRLADYLRRFSLTPERRTEAKLFDHLDDLISSPSVVEKALAQPITKALLVKEYGPGGDAQRRVEVLSSVFETIRCALPPALGRLTRWREFAGRTIY